MKEYDYIIVGAGCAGLSLLMRLMDDDEFHKKRVLLIDKDKKNSNDRTWCFWEKGSGYFESIVFKSWETLLFKKDGVSKQLDVGAYQYKMIRALDFYNYCFERIKQFPNVEYRQESITYVESKKEERVLVTPEGKIHVTAQLVFSSIGPAIQPRRNTHFLLQHFKGLVIQTEQPAFNEKEAVLMDFNIPQQNYPAAFFYMLPLENNKALVEYTVFSKEALVARQYDEALQSYISNNLQIKDFKVLHQEYGEIPMTNYRFPVYENGIYYIGAAGGQTKASTGYTFSFIQKQARHITEQLAKGRTPDPAIDLLKQRFHLYDSILLRVLEKNKMPGAEIFSQLFHKMPAHEVLAFLDNESSVKTEWNIMNAMPRRIFLPAALKELFL